MSQAGCRVGRVGHVGIRVSDLDKSIDFYRKVVGLKLTGKWGPPNFRSPVAFMRAGNMHHDCVIFEIPEDVDRDQLDTTDTARRPAVGLDHVAFEVAEREDWLLAIDHVRACGVELVAGPVVHGHESSGPMNNVGGSGSHAFYFLDPDGNRVEIYCWMMTISQPSVAAPAPDL